MRKTLLKLRLMVTMLGAVGAILFLDTRSAAHAWDCDVHIALAMRAALPLVPKQRLTGLPWEFCKSHKPAGGKINQRSRRPKHGCNEKQAYFEFVHGAQDSDDDDFRNTPVKEHSHQREAPGRAIRSMEASARAFAHFGQNNLDSCGPEDPYATLGRSVHYLQDWGDPTKYLDSITHSGPNTRKSVSRHWANNHANAMIEGKPLPAQLQRVASDAKNRARNAMRSARNPQDVLRAVEQERRAAAEYLRGEFHRLRASQHTPQDRQRMDRQIAIVMTASMAYLEAAQQRWLDIWLNELKRLAN